MTSVRFFAGLAVGLGACRAAPDDMAGVWAGRLACRQPVDDGVLTYDTTVDLRLEAASAQVNVGVMQLVSAYFWQGSDIVQSADFDVEVRQTDERGPQPVVFTEVSCTAAAVTVDGGPFEEGCGAVGATGAPESATWDGEDALSLDSAVCAGTLTRAPGGASG